MALVLRMEGRRLGQAAAAAFAIMEAGSGTVFVPTMVFAEILYLSEKARIGIKLADVAHYMRAHPGCKEHPMSLGVVESAGLITDIPELHDRLIAGTARLLGLPLLTDDPRIGASTALSTLW
jgi:predicted nucleic acid-binding protein